MVKFLNRWWLPLLIISVPFERIPSWNVLVLGHSVALRINLLIAIIGIIAFGIDTLHHTKWGPRHPAFWLLVYVGIALLSVVVSIDKGRSLVAFVATVITLATALVVADAMPRYRLHTLLKFIAATATAVSLFGLYQFIGDSVGLSTHLTGLRPIYTKKVFGFPRVQSTGLEPLFFANYLITPILLMAALIYSRLLRARTYAPLLVLYVLILALTLSRGGIIAAACNLLILGVVLWGMSNWKSRAYTVIGVAAGVLLAIGMIYGVTASTNTKPHSGTQAVDSYVHQSTHVTSGVGSADSDRVLDRRLAIQAFKQRPILGQGLGAFGTFAKKVDPTYYPAYGNSPTVNDEYLEVLAETGVLGLIALTGFVVALGWQIIAALRQSLDSTTRVWIWSLTAAGIAFGIQYYAFSTLYIMSIWVTLGLLMGLTATAARNRPV
jgi:O-antigen ligase